MISGAISGSAIISGAASGSTIFSGVAGSSTMSGATSGSGVASRKGGGDLSRQPFGGPFGLAGALASTAFGSAWISVL